MKKFFSFALIVALGLLPTFSVKTVNAQISDRPTWIYAPSIGLLSPIQGMGVTANGELDVPSGYTNNVGWYEKGVTPGETGTAVLDAHVFAAFKNLSLMKPGESIYMYMASGKVLEFKVTTSTFYDLKSLSPLTLFAPTYKKQLNLITCAGTPSADLATYTHRLIVSAEQV